MTIEKIISANEKNFEKWDEQLQEHWDLPFHSGVTDPQEVSRIFYQTNDLLYAIAQNFITYGKFKDTWDISKCSHNVFGQHLYLNSEKLDINFYWGVDQDTFYIESFMIHPENLRHMTDEFWEMLLELKTIGKLELNCPTLLSPELRPFMENKTSSVFQLIRSFMLQQLEVMKNNPFGAEYQVNLGTLVMKWDFNTPWGQLLEQSCKAFKMLYSMNYMLWKISDLNRKKSINSI
ncbi:hypothetical protein ABDJ41_20745 [Pedobacter sp. ASV1-7]|uniref:hypothetical protein n=1 Tax=Pedobacter sp. ASV1-7 TaxID=3145237 RepID=UPI0032E89A7B